jgi:hypothetical protein
MRFKKYLHSILEVLTLMLLPQIALGQSDTIVQSKEEQNHSLFAGLNYGSNLIYLGSTISGNLPYYSASLTYSLKDKFFVSASASHVSETSPYIAFYSLSASYNQTVNSWFDYSASAAYYKTAESLQETLFRDFGYINFTAGFDWKILYTKLSLSGILSESRGGYIQLRNSRYFQTGLFLKEKAFISFDPNFSFLFGQIVDAESAGTSKFGNAPPFGQNRKKPGSTTTEYSYSFGMIDTEFSLPVTFNFSNFSLEAEALYILPVYSNPEYSSPEGFSFNITAFIKIL